MLVERIFFFEAVSQPATANAPAFHGIIQKPSDQLRAFSSQIFLWTRKHILKALLQWLAMSWVQNKVGELFHQFH